MRVARWRWVLVSMVVVVAACLPSTTQGVPASFTEYIGPQQTFTAMPVSRADENPDAVVRLIRERYPPPFKGRAVPVFGVLTCIAGHEDCLQGRQERQVWLVVFPDVTGPTGDVAWVLVGDDDDLKHPNDPNE